jgi:pimeloyl-ACP methyl ester carboxylesterase
MKITSLYQLMLSACILISTISQAQTSNYYSSFDKTKIHYQIAGKGEPILLIHGFTNTLNDWKKKPIYDSLLSKGYQLILVDLRGNGLSDKPENPVAYANNAEAKDLMGLMQYLQFKSYKAIGYSRGSIILASLLVMDQHCNTAVLGGMGADFTNPNWPRRIGFYNALMNDTIPGYESFRKYIGEKGLNPKVLASQQKEQPSTSKAQLAKLKQSVLVICGTEDADNGNGKELQQMIPNSRFVSVPGNHNSATGTKKFAIAILHFLAPTTNKSPM